MKAKYLIICTALIIGISIFGCTANKSNGKSGIDSALNGTWIDNKGDEFRLNNGNFEYTWNGIVKIKGTYIANGNNLTTQRTHINELVADITPGLLSQNELETVLKNANVWEYYSDDFDNMFSPTTGTYSINENTLTFTTDGDMEIFNRKN